jgi:hypothetical protein
MCKIGSLFLDNKAKQVLLKAFGNDERAEQ